MNLKRSFLLSILIHSLLIFAFVEFGSAVKVPQNDYVRIDLSFIKMEEKKKPKRVVRKVVKAPKKKTRKIRKVKRKPLKKVKPQKVVKKESVKKQPLQTKEIKSIAKEEKETVQKANRELEKPPENAEEVSMKREEPKTLYPLPEDYPVGIDEEDVEEEEESYEEEYAEENLSRIREVVQSYLSYPIIARRMGWEGTVVVRFVLTSEGEVKDTSVERSSGFEVLDRNALEVIKLASKDFPKPSKDVVVVIPVIYSLEEY